MLIKNGPVQSTSTDDGGGVRKVENITEYLLYDLFKIIENCFLNMYWLHLLSIVKYLITGRV